MRLFVAVDLDAAAREALAAVQDRLRARRDSGSPLRWVQRDHLHLTLVFLGDVEEARGAAIAKAIDAPVALTAFDLAFGGLGVFPERGAPRALWVGATSGAAEARTLQRALADRVAALGVTLDSRPFSPHLTVARWKTSRPSDRRRVLEGASDRTIARVRVDHTTLYQSRLSSAGPTYTPLARANLIDHV